MKIGTGVVIASACVLAGCAGFVPTSGGGSGQDDCDSNGVCHVTISVTMCHFITARPDPVTIGYRRPNMNIHWEFDHYSDSYTFMPDDGIALKQPSSDFDAPDIKPRLVKMKDKNATMGNYDYSIHIKSSIWGECKKVDPTIVNKGQG